ncbi:hypothetical protein [Actinosynnema sp. NPDC023587]|uniref:hypothetical protein n=1 Tax=Actinosynnema sp. NPDC023587 TaxID=3154695 RepID=UPI0033FFF3C2
MVTSRGALTAAVLVVSLGACGQQVSPAASVGSATRPSEPLRTSLCDAEGDLTSWMRADGLPVDDAKCTAESTDARKLRAFGKWTFPSGSRAQSHVESVEIAVFADRGTDGGSAFDDLKGSYPPHEQRTIAGHYSRVTTTRGKTIVNLPELADPLDITITTTVATSSDAQYADIRAAHLRALEQLVPVLTGA